MLLGFISNMLNPNPDTGIDSILNLNMESTSLVDVPVTTNVEMPPSSVTTLPPPPIPFIQPQQQTPVSTPTIVPNKLRTEAQVDNEDFINKIDENMKKTIKEQVKVQVKEQVSKILPKIEKFVNDQLEAEVLTRSSNKAKTSHAVAANLSELELKKIRIDKMENNKSIDRSIQQKTLYKALVDAYETDKDIHETYGDIVTFKRRGDDEDEDEEPFTGSNRGSKRRRAGKEPESTSAPKEKTSMLTGKSKERSKSHQKSTGKSTQAKEPIHATLPAKHGLVQPWISTLARNEDPRDSFNELMDTPLDFSTFVMNRLKVDTLTPELLADPTYELMKGSCKSLVELEYFLKEVCKATTDQLDWNNPEGHQYPHDLRKPLPLIPNSRGRRVIPFDHFINNDLAYLSGGKSSQTYATSGRKCQQFYGFAVNRESARDVYSRHRIFAVIKLKIVEWNNYKHLDWITIHRDDDKLYTFKEGDYNRLHLQDIEDMLLLLVQGKLTNLNVEERLALGVSLRMFTRSVVLRRHVEDLQLGVERSGYQQKDRKPSQNDKTEHGMEKTVQNQGQSPKIPKSESILKNQQSNRSRN
ncbi:hypothetical protein Tco_0559486 [Tanacetum coccineum]